MARFRQEYRLSEPQDRNYLRLFQYLTGRGYSIQQYWGVDAFCKGSAALGNETMVQLIYTPGTVRVEAWLKAKTMSGGISEQGIEGYYGMALKGELKRIVVELDSLLGGPANRIGYNSYLLGKNTASVQTAPVRFQPVPPQPVQQRPQQAQPAPKPEQSVPVLDINRCTQMDLLQLPGMNVALAKKAVEFRTQRGGFRSTDEFIEVLQIKPHFAVQILPRITVGQSQERAQPDAGAASGRKFDI